MFASHDAKREERLYSANVAYRKLCRPRQGQMSGRCRTAPYRDGCCRFHMPRWTGFRKTTLLPYNDLLHLKLMFMALLKLLAFIGIAGASKFENLLPSTSAC